MRAARATGAAADATLLDARFQSKLSTTQEFLNALYSGQLVTVREQYGGASGDHGGPAGVVASHPIVLSLAHRLMVIEYEPVSFAS